MGAFFIETTTGQVATQRQLVDADLTAADGTPHRPWLRIQGPSDASTLWYAVLRRQVREGVFIGTLCIRHQAHHASLLAQGWHEISPTEISDFGRQDPASPETA